MTETEYAEVFREEAAELLEELETSLLDLEKFPDDLKLVGRVFRAMHTIKGSGAMFGFDDIAGFSHHVETVLDKVREGRMAVSKELIDLTLRARDHILALLDAVSGGEPADENEGREIINALEGLADHVFSGEEGPEVKPAFAPRQSVPAPSLPLVHYRIRFSPAADFFSSGGEVEPLLAELRDLGECTVFTHEDDAGPKWDVLLSTDKGGDAVRDVFVFLEPAGELEITPLGGEDEFPEHKMIGEILVERGDITPEELREVLNEQKPLGEMLVTAKVVSRSKVEAALAEQQRVSQKKAGKAVESIRVAADKLDRLIDLVGELVVNQARLTQAAAGYDRAELMEPVEEVERLTTELRDCVLNIRMMPIGTTFARFKRLVRDLSSELGKEVEMETEGAQTELDKNVIDKLGDPLVHLIRNCIDHGIESPDAREAAGKPRRGRILLSAAHSGANVALRVTDDGRGLDREAILAKALKKGLITPGEQPSDRDVYNLIFAPGFSTAATVTSVSGRGVGMDVVMNTVKALKGTVEVESVPGRGSTVSITLPLTLAIIDGLLVRAGETSFVLPLAQVEECMELSVEDMAGFSGRRMIQVRDELVPYVRLRDFFGVAGAPPSLEHMVIVKNKDNACGLVLDEVVGEHQTVIKSLGWAYRQAEALSGATILGNGEVALIVDVAGLIMAAGEKEGAVVRHG